MITLFILGIITVIVLTNSFYSNEQCFIFILDLITFVDCL